MREIKFRAWDEENKNFIDMFGLRFTKSGEVMAIISLAAEMWGPHQVTLLQFTGLKDKNGKEIYEGDILKDNAIVQWFDEIGYDGGGGLHPGFYCKRWGEHFSDGDKYIELSYWDGFGEKDYPIEVIGNIYENPELLEK